MSSANPSRLPAPGVAPLFRPEPRRRSSISSRPRSSSWSSPASPPWPPPASSISQRPARLLRAPAARIFLLRQTPFVIPRRITSWLAVIYFLLFFLDFFFFSGRDFVAPAVHLVLFGMCVKLFNVERDRDYVYLAVLSFLMVLSAAILTVDSAFLAAFALFLMLAVFCFMAMELRRSALAAANSAPLAIPGLRTRRRAISPLQRLSGSLARTTAVMVLAHPGRRRAALLRHAPHQRRLSLPLRPKRRHLRRLLRLGQPRRNRTHPAILRGRCPHPHRGRHHRRPPDPPPRRRPHPLRRPTLDQSPSRFRHALPGLWTHLSALLP